MCPHNSFRALNVALFLGALNDNALKVVACLLALEWAKDPAASSGWIALAGAAFVLPYLLFSMFAGSMADRCSKRNVLVAMQWVEVMLMGLATAGLGFQSLPSLVLVLFCTGTQSALFSPAKYGLLPEIFSQARLAWANGVVEVILFAGILIGTLAGSFATDILQKNLTGIGLCLAVLATVGALASHGVCKTPAADPGKKLRLNPIADVWDEWKILRANRLLQICTCAIGYFWLLGALVQMNTLGYARHLLGAGPAGTGILLTGLAVGTGLGSYLAGRIAGPPIRLITVRFGIFGVGLLLVALAFTHASFVGSLSCLFLLGIFGGGYIVPLNTVIQARSPINEKGRVIATTNFFSFSGILLASGLLWFLGSFCGIGAHWIFGIAGIVTLVVAVVMYRPFQTSGARGEELADRTGL